MKTKKEKLSLVHVSKVADIGEGILWLIFGACSLVGESLASTIILAIGLFVQIDINIYLKVKEKDMDPIDEMARAHEGEASKKAFRLTALLLLFAGLAALLVDMFAGFELRLDLYVMVAFTYGLMRVLKGSIFIKLEKEAN